MICQKEQWNNRCCCNCKYLCDITCHPWNKQQGKGSVKQIFGYGCMAQLDETQQVIFFENSHGMCEMHERRVNDEQDKAPPTTTS